MIQTFAARPMDPIDTPEALAIAAASGAHGIYVANALSGTARISERGDTLAFYGAHGMVGLAYFGVRGNLLLLQNGELDGRSVARAVQESTSSWRIALGPPAIVDALAVSEPRPALVHRRQLYFGMAPDRVSAALVRDDVRLAERRDLASLVEAALDLNRLDLHVDPRRVHKGWLRDSIRRRIKAGQTMVIGPVGEVTSKLDLGSDGTYGTMVEGVYTFPEMRGRGLAAGLVATVASRMRSPLVCLHVAADNEQAQSAYRRAGMDFLADCRLLLRL